MAETAPVIQGETGVVIGPAEARRGTGQLSETVRGDVRLRVAQFLANLWQGSLHGRVLIRLMLVVLMPAMGSRCSG
jgi:hypothetical protein